MSLGHWILIPIALIISKPLVMTLAKKKNAEACCSKNFPPRCSRRDFVQQSSTISLLADFNLSGGCFGTDTDNKKRNSQTSKFTKLKVWRIFVKFEWASCLIQKHSAKSKGCKKKPTYFLLEKIFARMHASYARSFGLICHDNSMANESTGLALSVQGWI